MALTSIGSQLTPGTPIDLTFAGDQGLPSQIQSVILIGHQSATAGSASGANYIPIQMANVATVAAASAEAAGYFGDGTELAKMVIAAVKANQGGTTFPPIKCIPLAAADADFGASDAALTAADKISGEYIASPYDGNGQTLSNKLLATAAAMSGATRVDQGQYGTMGVAVNRSVTNPSNLFKYDTAFGSFHWLRDTGSGATAPALSLGEEAAAIAAQLAANGVPFNPVKNKVIPNILAPLKQSDWISVGAGMESEVCLQQGWSPIRVLPNGSVAHVRARTLRVTTGDGITAVTAYFDVMDFNVLFFWRRTLATRFNQPDLTQTKASSGAAKNLLAEVIRLAQLFQEQGMFQGVDELAKQFIVERNVSDRSRFDVFTPVNVIPILAVIAANVQATTVGDTLTL